MKKPVIICLALLAALPAYAGQPEAREVARLNNCTPKKIEVFQNQLGSDGKAIYLVTCNIPKTTDKNAPSGAPDSLLVSCEQSLCTLLRPVAPDKK